MVHFNGTYILSLPTTGGSQVRARHNYSTVYMHLLLLVSLHLTNLIPKPMHLWLDDSPEVVRS